MRAACGKRCFENQVDLHHFGHASLDEEHEIDYIFRPHF